MAIRDRLLTNVVEDYLEVRQSEGLAKGTLDNVSSTLRRLAVFCGAEMETRKLTSSHLARYLNILSKTNAAGSMNKRREHAGMFVDWLKVERLISVAQYEQLANGRKRTTEPDTSPPRIGAETFPAVLKSAQNQGAQERALISYGLFTLCRVSEITYLRLGSIDWAESEMDVYCPKTKRLRPGFPINDDLRPEAAAWLDYYGRVTHPAAPAKRDHECGWERGDGIAAFLTAHPDWHYMPHREFHGWAGNRKARRVYTLLPLRGLGGHPEDIVKAILEDIGIAVQKGTGMHLLRRSGARAFFDSLGADDRALLTVSWMLGHKNLITTVRYLGLEMEGQRQKKRFQGGQRMYPQAAPEAAPAANVVRFPAGGDQDYPEAVTEAPSASVTPLAGWSKRAR